MSVGWYLAPYKVRTERSGRPARYCAMDDFTPQIMGVDGGDWSESEILGDIAVVKVRASLATLSTIAGTAPFFRIPNHTAPSDTLGDLTGAQRNALLNKLQALGYTSAEIQAALPANWVSLTLGQVLRFAATRRLKPRWDDVAQVIKVDGIVQACRPIADVDRAVSAQPLGHVQLAVLAWTSFLSGLYFGTGFRPSHLAIEYFAREAVRLGLTIQEHSYDFLAWVAQNSSMLLFRLFGAFPTTGILDTFAGADENPITTNWSGPTLIIGGVSDGQMRKLSQQVLIDTAAKQCDSWYDISTFGPNSECYFDVPTLPASGDIFTLYVRLASPGVNNATDGYSVDDFIIGSPNRTRIYRLDNSVATQLGADINEVTWAAGDSAGVQMIGSVITPTRRPSGGSWALFTATRSDGTYTAPGNIGMGGNEFSSVIARYDNFGGGTVAGGATLTPPSSMNRGMNVGMNRRLVQV